MARGGAKQSSGAKRSSGQTKPFELEPVQFIIEFPGPQAIAFRRVKGFAEQLEQGDIPLVVKPVVQKRIGGDVDEVIDLVGAGLIDPIIVRSGAELAEVVATFKRGPLKQAEKAMLARDSSGD